MDKYEVLGIVGEGAYGVVYKCRNRFTHDIVAIKKFKDVELELQHTMLRELHCVQKISHPNIVRFIETFTNEDTLYIVFEYVERNLLEVLEDSPSGLPSSLIQTYVYQMCRAVHYLHQRNIIHRDVKPENLLINSTDHSLKLCDFGFARDIPNTSTQITDYVATRWYRAPELLITGGFYGVEVDYWAIGCIMGELVDGQPLFPGDNEVDQINKIQRVMGRLPAEQVDAFYMNPTYKGKQIEDGDEGESLEMIYGDKVDEVAIDFMKGLLELDPKKRLCGDKVFEHAYFRGMETRQEENNVISELPTEENHYEDTEVCYKGRRGNSYERVKVKSESDDVKYETAKTYKTNEDASSNNKRKLKPIKYNKSKYKSHTMSTRENNKEDGYNDNSPSRQSMRRKTPPKIKKYYQTNVNTNATYQSGNTGYKQMRIPKTMNIYQEQGNSNKMVVQLKPLRVKEIHKPQIYEKNPYTTQVYFPSITNNKFYLSKKKYEEQNKITKKKGIKFKDVPNLPKIYKMNNNSLYFSNLMAYINLISN